MLIINQRLGIKKSTWYLRINDNSLAIWYHLRRGEHDVKRQRAVMTSMQPINKAWVTIMFI